MAVMPDRQTPAQAGRVDPPTADAAVASDQGATSQLCVGSVELVLGLPKSSAMFAVATVVDGVAVSVAVALDFEPLIAVMYQRPAVNGIVLALVTTIDSFDDELIEWYCA